MKLGTKKAIEYTIGAAVGTIITDGLTILVEKIAKKVEEKKDKKKAE